MVSGNAPIDTKERPVDCAIKLISVAMDFKRFQWGWFIHEEEAKHEKEKYEIH